MAIFLSYEIGLSARFSSAKLHKIVDICKKNRNYFIDNQLFILNFSIDYIRYETGLSDLVREISNKSNIPYYNFSDCPDICTPELFNDESHLNINGATLYSMKIADLLKELKL